MDKILMSALDAAQEIEKAGIFAFSATGKPDDWFCPLHAIDHLWAGDVTEPLRLARGLRSVQHILPDGGFVYIRLAGIPMFTSAPDGIYCNEETCMATLVPPDGQWDESAGE